MYCSECGQQNSTTNKYCVSCGMELQQAKEHPVSQVKKVTKQSDQAILESGVNLRFGSHFLRIGSKTGFPICKLLG